MTATYTEARDEIFTVIDTAWDSTAYPIVWPNDASDDAPTDSSSSGWLEVLLEHASGFQPTLTSDVGSRRFRRIGAVVCSIRIRTGDGAKNAYTLGQVIVDALEGTVTPSCIRFFDVTLNEIGPDKGFFQVNVSAAFEYDQIK